MDLATSTIQRNFRWVTQSDETLMWANSPTHRRPRSTVSGLSPMNSEDLASARSLLRTRVAHWHGHGMHGTKGLGARRSEVNLRIYGARLHALP
jgi:hypothetical protein